MATDYNANLIAELYAAKEVEDAVRISEEMVGIGDLIFPRQIYEVYKKFKETHYSHYFVSDLTKFKSKEIAEILKNIARTTKREADISMMIEYLLDIEYFEPQLVDMVMGIFEEEVSSGESDDYNIEPYFKYLVKSEKEISKIESLLKLCFEDDKQTISARKFALKSFLKLKPKEHISLYYNNYELIKGKKAECIFAEEISTWHGGIIPEFHKKILETGSPRAQEILKERQSKKAEEKQFESKKEQEKIKEEYPVVDVISSIAELRLKINTISIADNRFGFPIFPPSEEIYKQSKPAKDKEALIGYCMVIRSLVQSFDNKIKELEIAEEKIKEVLPGVINLDGSLNKFHFLLLEKGLSVDPDIFGFRNTNRIVSKFAHPEEESDLIEILKKEKLLDLYTEDNWSMLHREILLRYRNALDKLMSALKI